MAKPTVCKYCKGPHQTTFCWTKPRPSIKVRKSVRRLGKVGREWLKTRVDWFDNFPPDKNGYYQCYICGDNLLPKETTLDHIESRSRRPDLRSEFSNLAPCCYRCNKQKGSRNLEEYLQSLEKVV